MLLLVASIVILEPTGGDGLYAQDSGDARLQPYIDALARHGREPVDFVLDKLNEYDLILFDDALHTAVEPFEFYQQLVQHPEFAEKARYVFFEVLPINEQPALDAYLSTYPEDKTLLYPAFQGGTGWSNKTYFDLLHTIYQTNQSLPKEQRIRAIAVNNPTYWAEVDSREELDLIRDKAWLGRDYDMYRIILSYLDTFKAGEKGIFLTNTRHAYKGIKNEQGVYYWNTGTFFYQWHPGKTYAIRFHNVTLHIQREQQADTLRPKTSEGLEAFVYKWARMEDGLWDSAFRERGNKPVALPLKNNVFGRASYVGNHMRDVAPGQRMYDAYDALIFLAPLERLRQTATVDFIYTEAFKKDLIRRHEILYTPEQLREQLQRYEVETLRELIEEIYVAEPEVVLPQAGELDPIDAWKNEEQAK